MRGGPFAFYRICNGCLLPDDFALTWQEKLQAKLLAIEDTVCEIADPVAQADYPAVITDMDIIGDMPVSEHEVFDVGVLLKLLSGKLKLVFIFYSHKRAQGTMFFPALF